MEAGCSRCVVLAVLVALLSISALFVASDSSAVTNPDRELIEEFPDADYIISDGGRTSVLISCRNQTSDGVEWTASTVSQGSSLNLIRLSETNGSLKVVMASGRLGTLTLIQTDVIEKVSPVDVDFTMVGGQLDSLKILTVPSSLEYRIEKSYTLMFSPLGQISIDLRGGDIGDLIPTEDMVAVDGMDISIRSGVTVDRVFTSGTNGRYRDISLALLGGTVGYMANQKSVVGTLDYRLESGSVEYFCIGSDTEYGSNSNLTNLNTFYVQRDVSVFIDDTVSIRMAIFGSGILDTPTKLWNGEQPTPAVAKNVYIDAHGTSVTHDRCFMTNNRSLGSAYQFNSYSIGSTPRARTISTEYYVSGGRGHAPIYGDNGIWESPTSMTLNSGYGLYVDALFSIPSESRFDVGLGSMLTLLGHTTVSGVLSNNGTIHNSGIIEKRDGGSYEGNEPQGNGFLAYCIDVNPTEGRIDVMASDDDTVILRTDSTVYVSRISVLLKNGDRQVTIAAPDTMYVGGNVFMISLRSIVQGGVSGFDLYIEGVEESVLASMDISVTVPMPGAASSYYVYYIDDTTGEYVLADVDDTSYREITFKATGNGRYYVSMMPPGGISDDNPNPGMLNIILAVAIVIVGAMVVYTLLRKD